MMVALTSLLARYYDFDLKDYDSTGLPWRMASSVTISASLARCRITMQQIAWNDDIGWSRGSTRGSSE
jgi:hypothetical protein